MIGTNNPLMICKVKNDGKTLQMNAKHHLKISVVIAGMMARRSLHGGLTNMKEEADVSEMLTNIMMATPLTTIKTEAKETANKMKWTNWCQEGGKMSWVDPNPHLDQV